ncbi:hypothetical protein AJ80_07008 [Polytolypa hystricis UAMH7299]|uniref:Uncharacterized protein n=1 Tax=Polytolypa hystricis (strain UAMH7299) TaxID=1447883 RepID=A0A2B7XTD1_POLH7|nr:hypothetical protein AJ80_07008 [Polytolypa hystricis UAMH7299]
MFHIGASHKCDSCHMSKEQHDKRHKEIASLIQSLHRIDQEEDVPSTPTTPVFRQNNDNNMPFINRNPDVDGDIQMSDGSSEGNDTAVVQIRQTPSMRRQDRQRAKIDKSNAKALNRKNIGLFQTLITPRNLIEKVGEIIHGDLIVLPTMTLEEGDEILDGIIQMYEDFDNEVVQKNPGLKGQKRRTSDPRDSINKLELSLIREIMVELGVRPSNTKCSKERNRVVARVADAIYADIEQVSNEAREIKKRKAAYFAFAGERAKQAIVHNNKITNWETGEKLTGNQ